MNQWLTVAVIGGPSGKAVRDLAQRWHGQFKSESAGRVPKVSSVVARREIRQFVKAVHRHAARPPVLFYRRHIDQWSMGDVFDVFPSSIKACSATIRICCDAMELYFPTVESY